MQLGKSHLRLKCQEDRREKDNNQQRLDRAIHQEEEPASRRRSGQAAEAPHGMDRRHDMLLQPRLHICREGIGHDIKQAGRAAKEKHADQRRCDTVQHAKRQKREKEDENAGE